MKINDLLDFTSLCTTVQLKAAEPENLVASEAEQPEYGFPGSNPRPPVCASLLAEIERKAHFGIWSCGPAAESSDFSEEARRLLGFDPLAPVGDISDYGKHLHVEDRLRIAKIMQSALADGRMFDTEVRVVRKDGGLRWLRVIGMPNTRAPHTVVGVLFDITSLKRIQMRQRVELEIARCLVRANPPAQVLGRIIRIVCQTLGWEWGAYWSLNESTNRLLLLKGLCVDSSYEDFAKASRHVSFGPGLGLIGEVFECGKPRWVNDISRDQRLLRRELAVEAGLRGGFAFPVVSSGRVVGVLEFFSRYARQPDASLPAISRTLGIQIGQFIERERADERIRYLATHDQLSGLFNRAAFNEQLNKAIVEAQRHKRQIALLFIDLDGFKQINDALGHDAGDILLRQFAQLLRGCFRDTETIARVGGDEFAVLVRDYGGDMGVLAGMARKVLDVTGVPFRLQGREYRIGASIGVGMFPEDGADAASLFRSADIAMYRVKWHGESNYRFSSARADGLSHDGLAMEASLSRALRQGDGLSLVFQPIYHLERKCVMGFEALLRWSHPEFGNVPPARFIPLAEETGLIRALGLFALRRACEEAVKWPCTLTVSVNVSARQLIDESFPEKVASTLRAAALSPDRLRLEITESALMQQRTVPLLEQTRKLGVRLSIDDFGTGYSSLAYLKRLPVDSIKLDQTFVRGLPHDANDTAIARAVIGLGHNLKLKVVAEGVERDEQREYLRELGCDAIQGYLVSQPLSASEVEGWLLGSDGDDVFGGTFSH